MDPQDFYNRFKTELDRRYNGKKPDDAYYMALYTARVAAGLT